MARNFRFGPKWIPAVVDEKLGPLLYLVKTYDGELWRRHVDHIIGVENSEEREENSTPNSDDTGEDWDFISGERRNPDTPELSPSDNADDEEPPYTNTTGHDTISFEYEPVPTDLI